jgi:hypothetical protein
MVTWRAEVAPLGSAMEPPVAHTLELRDLMNAPLIRDNTRVAAVLAWEKAVLLVRHTRIIYSF